MPLALQTVLFLVWDTIWPSKKSKKTPHLFSSTSGQKKLDWHRIWPKSNSIPWPDVVATSSALTEQGGGEGTVRGKSCMVNSKNKISGTFQQWKTQRKVWDWHQIWSLSYSVLSCAVRVQTPPSQPLGTKDKPWKFFQKNYEKNSRRFFSPNDLSTRRNSFCWHKVWACSN